jgi:hypothetical protein
LKASRMVPLTVTRAPGPGTPRVDTTQSSPLRSRRRVRVRIRPRRYYSTHNNTKNLPADELFDILRSVFGDAHARAP